MEKICERCGVAFETKYARQKYCSDACAKGAHNERRRKSKAKKKSEIPPIVRTCEVCGKEFKTSRANTVCCSEECKKQRRLMQIKLSREYHARRRRRCSLLH